MGAPGEETVEIAHEALATQWPRYQAWLEDAAEDKRVFDRLMDETLEWVAAGEEPRHLALGYDLEIFGKLQEKRPLWLSDAETRFVQRSLDAERESVAERKQLLLEREETKLREAIQAKAQRRIATIALLAVAVVDLVIGFSGLDRYRDQVRQAHEFDGRFATLASNYETNLLWQSNRILQSLAHQPPVLAAIANSPSRGSECADLLEMAIRPYPSFAVVVLRNAKGQPVCQSDPSAQPVNAADMDWFKMAMETRRETISGYQYAPRLQEAVITYATPVVSDRDVALGVMSVAIRLEWLSAIGQEPGLPLDAMVYLLDHAGQVLVAPRKQELDTLAGMPDPEIIQDVIDGYVRTFDAAGQDGVQRNYAVNVIGDEELFVLLGQPTTRLIDPLRTSLLIQVGVLALVSALVVAFILWNAATKRTATTAAVTGSSP